jgi:hypothetical protein
MDSKVTPNSNQSEETSEYQHKSWSDSAEILARWVVDLVAIPVSFIAALLFQFLDRTGSGRKVLGALGFWIGTLLSGT